MRCISPIAAHRPTRLYRTGTIPLLLQFFDPTGRAALIVNRIGKGSCETHGKRLRI